MIRVIKKKSYSKRKPEDYRFQRKLKFTISRISKIAQILMIILSLAFFGWLYKFGGYEKTSNFIYSQATSFFIGLGLKIESVEIEGNKTVSSDQLLEIIFNSLGDISQNSIILIDLEKLKKDILEIGWIESVSIRKKLPSTIIINITERSPKVIWQSKGQIWLADDKGNLLTQKMEKKYLDLPVIIGQNSIKDIPEIYQIINSSKKLSKMVLNATKLGSRRWDINLNNNLKVKLPEKNATEAWKNLEYLEAKNSLFSKRINYIDMRIEGQLITGLDSLDILINPSSEKTKKNKDKE
jgi:cell division protein FtsQ